ncbi:MAG: hypothetical protein ABEK02_00825 [Haloquadratum sp.]
MPDTKNGREQKGRNKRSQLQEELYEKEIEAVETDEELPPFEPSTEEEFVAEEVPDRR